MACLFPQAWGWRSEKSGKQDAVEDDELLPQGGTIAPLPSLLSFSLNLDSVANRPSSSPTDAFSDDLLYVTCAAILCQAFVQHFNMLRMYVRALGLGDRTSNRGIIEPAPVLRSRMLAFDRKVQLLREVAAKLTLAVQSCSLHRHISDMSTLIQDLASSGDDSGSIDIGASVVHLAQALQDSAAAESQCSVLLQDMLFQIDNVLKFDVARAVALIISMEEAREALLSAMSKTRVRSTRPGPDEGRRRLQAEECLAARQVQYDRLTDSLTACLVDLSLRIDLVLAKALSTYVKVRGDAAAATNRSLIGCDMDVHKIDSSAMHSTHSSVAYHLLQDIPRPIALNAVVPQLLACPGYGFVNVLLEVASEAAQSIEADAIPQCALSLLDDLGFATDFIRVTILAECARASTRGAAPPFRSASNANRILVCAMQLGCGQYLMHTLSPLFASVVMGNGVGGDIASITSVSPPSVSGRTGGVDSITVVAALDEQVLNSIIGSISHAPMWLRCVCQHVFTVTCTSDDRGRSRYACGGVLLLCGFCPAISNPEKFGLLPASISVTEASRQILRSISRALTILANGYDVNSVDDGFMSLIRPSLEAAMPHYLSFLDQLMCSQLPAQVSSLLPPIKVWRSQREDVSIVMRFADRHAHRLRKSLAMRGHRRELLVLRHLLAAPRDALPTLEPSSVFLAARPSMSNPGAMQWASLQLVQPRSSAQPPRSRRSAVANGVSPQPAASAAPPSSNILGGVVLPIPSNNSVRSMKDATAHTVSSSCDDEVGVGIEVEVTPNGRVSVRRLENGGPAQRCGAVEVGDDIVAVDGQDIASVPNPMAVSARYLFGARGSRVTITLRRRGSAHTHSITLLRNSPYNMHHLDAISPQPADSAVHSNNQPGSYGPASSSAHSQSSKISATATSPKSLRFADGTATKDGHGGAPKRLRTCGVSFTKSSGVYVVKRARAGVVIPDALKPGMHLLQVDGTDVVDLTEADVLQLLLGPDGSMCSLTLQNPHVRSETITILLPRSYRGGPKDGTDASEDSDSSVKPVPIPAVSATVVGAASASAAEAKPQTSSSSGGLKSVYENLSMSLIGAATGRSPSARQGVQGAQQVGIGVSFVPAPDGSGFVISKILPGSAASRSALEAGDYVVTIDGNSVGGLDLNDLRALITGDVDSVASIGYRQQGSGSVKQVKIKRATLDPLVMRAMSSQQSFSVAPPMARSHSPQSDGRAAMQSLYAPSQPSVFPETLQEQSGSSSDSGRAVAVAASAPITEAPAEQSSLISSISPSSATADDVATVPAAPEQLDADEWSGSESSGYASGMGVLSEADGDGSDDDFGAAPLLQSPSKEIYQRPQDAHIQQCDPNIYDRSADDNSRHHQAQLKEDNQEQALQQSEPELHQQQQDQQIKSIHEEECDRVSQLCESTPQPHQEQQLQLQQNLIDVQEHVTVSRMLEEQQRPREEQQEQQQRLPSLVSTATPVSQSSTHLQHDEGHEETAAKFVFINTFGLTLCEDGRGYWYISAKVGENRLPALVIGDVIRTVADATARGWGADKMCASLDKGGVEIGIQRGLTAAMRFVTLPVADVTGSQMSATPVSRHGLGFAFRRNEDSGALVVTSVRDGSAAASCCCLEVGDVLLEVDGVHVVGLPARVVRDMLLGPEGLPAVIGIRPSTSGSSLAAAFAQRKPRASSLTIAETDFGSVLRIQLVRQRLPALPHSIVDSNSSSDVSTNSPADGGSMSDCSNGGGGSGDYGLGISFSPKAHTDSTPGDSSMLRFYVLRLVAGGPAEMCGLIQVPSFIRHVAYCVLILLQPGDELVSVDGVLVAGFSFARVRSAVVGAMGSVVELQLLRSSDGVSRRVFVPRCFPVGASSSGWSSMESERSDGEGVGTSNSFQSQAQTPASILAPGQLLPASDHDKDGIFGIGCTFRRDSRGRYRVKRVIKGGAAHSSHSVLSDGFAALVLSEGEFIERVGGHKGSICVLQLDRDDGGGHSHVVDVSVCRDGVMDEEQLQIPSSYTGKEPEDASGRQSPSVASERSVGSFDILKDGHSKVTLVQRCWYMLGLQLTKDTHKNVLVKSIRPESPAALCSSRTIRVGDCVRYVNSKAVNGRSVEEVLKDLVGDEGQSLEISFRAADEAKSQVVQLVRAAIPGGGGGGGGGNGADGSVSRGKSVGVGISFVRRAGGADSKFVVKRLVQGSDTAMQGDVEVNDVVVRVDGHPVKGWDEKALLAHVMGEEGTYCSIEFEREGVGRVTVDLLRQSSQSISK